MTGGPRKSQDLNQIPGLNDNAGLSSLSQHRASSKYKFVEEQIVQDGMDYIFRPTSTLFCT